MLDRYSKQKMCEYVDLLIAKEQPPKMVNKQSCIEFYKILLDILAYIFLSTMFVLLSVCSLINECWILFGILVAIVIIIIITTLIEIIQKVKRRKEWVMELAKSKVFFYDPDEERKIYREKL